MITLFLESALFQKNKRRGCSTCKLSYKDTKGKYHNKIFQERMYLVDGTEVTSNYLELSSLLIGLKQLKMEVLSKKKIRTLRIVSPYNKASYIKNSFSQMFNSWEYLDFRGVPHQDLWKQVYDIILALKEINIQYIIKDN